MKSIILLSILAVSAHFSYAESTRKTLEGNYILDTDKKNAAECSKSMNVQFKIDADGQKMLVAVGADKRGVVIRQDLEIEFEHDGFVGYNRFGGSISDQSAVTKHKTISSALILFGLPFYASEGTKLRLGILNKDVLVYKKWDSTYGFGSTLKCVYERIETTEMAPTPSA